MKPISLYRILCLLVVLPVLFFSVLFFTLNASAYENDPETCTHPGLYIETFDYPADCLNFAHRDKICSKCGTVVESKRTGSMYGEHVFDYEDVVNYGYNSDSCTSYMSSTLATIKCKVCFTYVKVQVSAHDQTSTLYHGLEQHKGLDTTNKFFDVGSDHWFYHCNSCNKDVYALIQSNRPYITSGIVDPDKCEHHYDLVSHKDATCTEEGYAEYLCSICSITHIEKTPAFGHQYENEEILIQPTCSTEGSKRFTCTKCDTVIVETMPIVDHDFSGEAEMYFPATCTHDGIEVHSCKYCKLSQNTVLPKDTNAHNLSDVRGIVSEGSCTKKAIYSAKCNDCGAVIQLEGDYADHHYVMIITKEATCALEGICQYQCSVCGSSKEEVLPKSSNHNFVFAGDCDEEKHSFSCTECGSKITMTHTFPDFYSHNATEHWHECVVCHYKKDIGSHKQVGNDMTCITCDYLISKEDIHIHSLIYIPEKEAKCLTSGTIAYYVCSGCNKCFTDNEGKNEILSIQIEVPALGHEVIYDEMVLPTCTQNGMSEGSHCHRCGEIIVKRTILEVSGHIEVKTDDVNATCYDSGLVNGTHCSVCGITIKEQEVVPATGHNYGEWEKENEEQHVHTCVCGKTETEEHVWDGGHKISGDASNKTYYKCLICGAQKAIDVSSGLSTFGCAGNVKASIALFSIIAVLCVCFLKKKQF